MTVEAKRTVLRATFATLLLIAGGGAGALLSLGESGDGELACAVAAPEPERAPVDRTVLTGLGAVLDPNAPDVALEAGAEFDDDFDVAVEPDPQEMTWTVGSDEVWDRDIELSDYVIGDFQLTSTRLWEAAARLPVEPLGVSEDDYAEFDDFSFRSFIGADGKPVSSVFESPAKVAVTSAVVTEESVAETKIAQVAADNADRPTISHPTWIEPQPLGGFLAPGAAAGAAYVSLRTE